MGVVTIEGSLTPSVNLPRGERRRVEVDDEVRDMVTRGYAIVVEGSLDDDPADDNGTPENAPDPGDDAPAKNASREVWAAFLTSKGIEFPDDESEKDDDGWAGRDDLVDIWEQRPGAGR